MLWKRVLQVCLGRVFYDSVCCIWVVAASCLKKIACLANLWMWLFILAFTFFDFFSHITYWFLHSSCFLAAHLYRNICKAENPSFSMDLWCVGAYVHVIAQADNFRMNLPPSQPLEKSPPERLAAGSSLNGYQTCHQTIQGTMVG